MRMTLALWRKEWQSRWLSLAVFSAAAFGFLLMYVLMFPSIRAQAASLSQVVASLDSVFKAMGIQDLGFSSLEGFLSIEYLTIVWPVLALVLIASWTGGMVAGEIDQRTIGLLLALPLGRSRIYWTKYAVVMAGWLVFVGCSLAASWPLAHLSHVTFNMHHYAKMVVMGWLFGWAFLSIGMLASVLWNERGKVGMTVGGLAIVMYVLTAVSGLKNSLSWLKYGSLFSYFDVQNVLVKGEWQWLSVGVMVAIGILGAIVGAWWFSRRDVAV